MTNQDLRMAENPDEQNYPHRYDAKVSGHIWGDLVYTDSIEYDDHSMVAVSYTSLEDGAVTIVLEMEEGEKNIGFSGYLTPDRARMMASSLERAADLVEQREQ